MRLWNDGAYPVSGRRRKMSAAHGMERSLSWVGLSSHDLIAKFGMPHGANEMLINGVECTFHRSRLRVGKERAQFRSFALCQWVVAHFQAGGVAHGSPWVWYR